MTKEYVETFFKKEVLKSKKENLIKNLSVSNNKITGKTAEDIKFEVLANFFFEKVKIGEKFFRNFQYLKCLKDLSCQLNYLHNEHVCLFVNNFQDFLCFNKVFFKNFCFFVFYVNFFLISLAIKQI